MSLTRVIFPLALFPLLITIASASYEPNPYKQEPPIDNDQSHESLVDHVVDTTDLVPNPIDQHDHPMPRGNGDYSRPDFPKYYRHKPAHNHPMPQGGYQKPAPEERENSGQKGQYGQKTHYEGLNYNNVIVQGVIYCKSSYSYTPLEGAVARITCPNSHGYKESTYSISSPETDERGYFLVPLPDLELIDVEKCKVYLQKSPSETCDVPTENGVVGAPLSLCHGTQADKTFYTMGTLFYTTETANYSVPKKDSLPNNNGY